MDKLAEQQANFEAEHKAKGWFTGVYNEEPNEISPGHRHGPANILGLEGSAKFTLDGNDVRELSPGHEIAIADNQLHAVVAGAGGFRYLFACPLEEARRQGLVD